MRSYTRFRLLALVGLASWVGIQGKLTVEGPPVDRWFIGGPHRPPWKTVTEA